MDVFVFPSETDAFGNVAQEANASGVPAIVTNQGGPKFIVRHNETGFIAENFDDFVKFSLELMDNPEKLANNEKSFARIRDVAFVGCGFRKRLRRLPRSDRNCRDAEKSERKSGLREFRFSPTVFM